MIDQTDSFHKHSLVNQLQYYPAIEWLSSVWVPQGVSLVTYYERISFS